MSVLIADVNNAQRHYLSELLAREFAVRAPVIEAHFGYSDAENIGPQGSARRLRRLI